MTNATRYWFVVEYEGTGIAPVYSFAESIARRDEILGGYRRDGATARAVARSLVPVKLRNVPLVVCETEEAELYISVRSYRARYDER